MPQLPTWKLKKKGREEKRKKDGLYDSPEAKRQREEEPRHDLAEPSTSDPGNDLATLAEEINVEKPRIRFSAPTGRRTRRRSHPTS